MSITSTPITRESIKLATEAGRKLREERERMRRALDTKPPRTAAEIEAANIADEFANGSIYISDDTELVTGISPSFCCDYRRAA